jgi:hypothetical protein
MFDVDGFIAKRQKTVTLDDGTVCLLRPPSMERAVNSEDLPPLSDQLKLEFNELGKLANVPGMDSAALRARAIHSATYADLYNGTLLMICDAVIGPIRFVLDRSKERPAANGEMARVWAGWLSDDDVNRLSVKIAEGLGYSKAEFASVAPFPFKDTADVVGADTSHPAKPTAAKSIGAAAGLALSRHVGQLAGVSHASEGSEDASGNPNDVTRVYVEG